MTSPFDPLNRDFKASENLKGGKCFIGWISPDMHQGECGAGTTQSKMQVFTVNCEPPKSAIYKYQLYFQWNKLGETCGRKITTPTH